jgi:hypothetical protein
LLLERLWNVLAVDCSAYGIREDVDPALGSDGVARIYQADIDLCRSVWRNIRAFDPKNLLLIDEPTPAVETWRRDVAIKVSLLTYLFDCVDGWAWGGGYKGMRFRINSERRRMQWHMPADLQELICSGSEFPSLDMANIRPHAAGFCQFVALSLLEALLDDGYVNFQLCSSVMATERVGGNPRVGLDVFRAGFFKRTPVRVLTVDSSECHAAAAYFASYLERGVRSDKSEIGSVKMKVTFRKKRAGSRSPSVYSHAGICYHITGLLFMSLPDYSPQEKVRCKSLSAIIFRNRPLR